MLSEVTSRQAQDATAISGNSTQTTNGKRQTPTNKDAGLLHLLFKGKPDDQAIYIWTNADKRSQYFFDVAAVAEYALKKKARSDIYFGVATVSSEFALDEKNEYKRGKNDSVAGVTALYADVDYGTTHQKKNLPLTQQDAVALVMRMPLAPTIIVDSGYGLHVYWLLKEFFKITSDERRTLIANLNYTWQSKLKELAAKHDWGVDATYDLARVLRVPDTINHKYTPDIKIVELLESSDKTYSVEDLQNALDGKIQASPKRVRFTSQSNNEAVSFSLDENASPPFDKWEALKALEPRAALSFDRKRKDFKDQSPSAYDMSLATFAALADWSDQEIVNLLIASRRKNGDDLKLRDDYYERTLRRAKDGETDSLSAAAVEDEAMNDEPQSEDKRDRAVRYLNRKLGIKHTNKLVKIEQHGVEDADYVFVFDNGNSLRIGDSDTLHQPSKVRNKLFTVGVTMPREASKEWDKILKSILIVRNEKETISEVEELRGYVFRYFNLEGCVLNIETDFDYISYGFAIDFDEEDKSKLVQHLISRKRHGFFETQSRTAWIATYNFIEWLNRNSSKRWTQKEVINMLSRQGFGKRSKSVRYKDQNGKSVVYNTGEMWVSENDYIPSREELSV